MPSATQSYSQEELLRLIQKKDKMAFGILFDTYSPVIFGLICKLAPDAKTAEEILQKSFIRVWQNINSFDPAKQRLLAWMLSMARAVAEEALRQKINKNSEIQKSTNSVLNNKEVLTLVYFRGYSLINAAEALNISVEELKLKLKMELDRLRTAATK